MTENSSIPFFLIYLGCCMLNCNSLKAQSARPGKKLIHLGWELTSPQVVKANYAKMEATSPFDGITFILRDTLEDGSILTEGSIFTKKLINRKDLEKSISDIKNCRFTQFKNNFVRVNTVPGNLKWTDNAGWDIVNKNMSSMAWFAKQAGLVGICYDPESYGEHQFKWNRNDGKSFDDTKSLAKERGKTMMTEIGKVYPNIVFWGLFLLSFERAAINADVADVVLMSDTYGLYPSFVDGLLEGLPNSAKMVEGNEDAYYSRDKENLLSIYNDSKVGLPKFLSTANQQKYKSHVSVGLGLYTDMYTNDFGKKYYFSATSQRTRLERFRERIHEAMEITDEYVWLYNEEFKWWDIPFAEERFDKHDPEPLIYNKLPGILESALFAKAPIEFLEGQLSTVKYSSRNLVLNGDFEQNSNLATEILDWTNKDCPPGYLQWRPEKTNFVITLQKNEGVNGTACAKMIGGNSILIKQVAVKPGETYFITIDGRMSGGDMIMSTRFMDESFSNFIDWGLNKSFAFLNQANNQWGKISGLVTVPESVYALQLLIEGNAQKSNDTFYIDNIAAYPIHSLFK